MHPLRIERILAVIELRGVEADLADALRRHFVDTHRLVVVQPLVKELDLERQPGAAPERLLRAVADIAKLVVGERLELLRERRWRPLVGARGKRSGALGDVIEAERVHAGCRDRSHYPAERQRKPTHPGVGENQAIQRKQPGFLSIQRARTWNGAHLAAAMRKGQATPRSIGRGTRPSKWRRIAAEQENYAGVARAAGCDRGSAVSLTRIGRRGLAPRNPPMMRPPSEGAQIQTRPAKLCEAPPTQTPP